MVELFPRIGERTEIRAGLGGIVLRSLLPEDATHVSAFVAADPEHFRRMQEEIGGCTTPELQHIWE